jgi:protein-S-isoprenylcysteine O-methyltransferase Ste14
MAKSEHNDGDVLAGRANSFPWPPLLLVACVAAAIVLDRQAGLAWPGLDDWPAQAVGLGFGVIGLTLIVTAIVTLANAGTTIMPHGISTELVTTGPYWRFRNPIYLGEAFMLLGAAELSKNVWFVIAAAVFAGLVTVLQILPEERHLEARFGDAYRDYKARSRRWL